MCIRDRYADLDVPWSPALLVIAPDGTILRAAPLRSPEDLRVQIQQIDAGLGPTGPPHVTAGS